MGGLECVGGGKLKNSGVMVMKENRLRVIFLFFSWCSIIFSNFAAENRLF